MTTWEQIEAKEKLLEGYVEQFNEIHRQAKRLKQNIIFPLQAELKQLYRQWKAELKNTSYAKDNDRT